MLLPLQYISLSYYKSPLNPKAPYLKPDKGPFHIIFLAGIIF